MQALIQSDLHFEFHQDHGKNFVDLLPAADIIILAGDISNYELIHDALCLFIEKYPHVIYTFGNHELYGGSFHKLRRDLKLLQEDFAGRFHLLDNSFVEINDQRFIGCPLFFPYKDGMEYSYWTMNDFSLIDNFAAEVFVENRISQKFLQDNLLSSDIVVTHYLPSNRCIHPKYVSSPLNQFFVCEMGPVIQRHKPKTWVFGHTHETMDFKFDKTRLVCNPFGYAGHEENMKHINEKFLEI